MFLSNSPQFEQSNSPQGSALSHLPSNPPLSDDDHAIGDCLVFEDPYLDAESSIPDSPPTEKISRSKKRTQAAEIWAENLVPDEWIEAQAEINITKKKRRRM
ncbi:Ankyrin repeat domain-containing protein, chloroplastic [Linum perenne]